MKRCVVVGYGGMGSWHARHILERGGAELAGIFDISEERVALARERGIYAYPSFEAVLADASVDFITIATPNEWHKPLAIAALRAGKHVISESPSRFPPRILPRSARWQTSATSSSRRTRIAVGIAITV